MKFKLSLVLFAICIVAQAETGSKNTNADESQHQNIIIENEGNMNPQNLLDLFKKHNLVSPSSTFPKNWEYNSESEFDDYIYEFLGVFAERQQVQYLHGDGGWIQGELKSEYLSPVTGIVRASNGKLSISDLKIDMPLDENGEESRYVEISISFEHDGKKYSWTFDGDDPFEYWQDVSIWAYKSLGGGYLYLEEDIVEGYVLPAEIVQVIEENGIYNHVHGEQE